MQLGVLRAAAGTNGLPARTSRAATPLPVVPIPCLAPHGACQPPALRGCVRAMSTIEFVEGISEEEAARFDRIAASLVARLTDVQDFIEGRWAAHSDEMVAEFWSLGLEPLPVSAITGTGTGEVLDAAMALLPPPRSAEQDELADRPLAVAIVGRPNVVPSTSAPAQSTSVIASRRLQCSARPCVRQQRKDQRRLCGLAAALAEGQSVATALQSSGNGAVEEDVLIEFVDVHKSFGDKCILRGATFKIRRGEAVGIIGASGTGKSTTLRLAAGLLQPDRGIVKIQGSPRIGLLSDDVEEPSLRVGMVFQNAALFDSLTVGENVGFLLYEHSTLPDAKIKELVADSLAKVGLRGVEDLYPAELSGGMKKRVALARAVVSDPQRIDTEQVIMYDEPTAGLDPVASTVVEDLMRSLHNTGSSDSDSRTGGISCYIVVTHQHSTIRRAVDRIIFLHQGTVVWEGSVAEFDTTDEPIVRQFAEGSLEGPISYV
ncbi:Protein TRIGALACTOSYLDIACYLGLYCEROL 3, chloroplastic, partial [Tetrabaena socialis]